MAQVQIADVVVPAEFTAYQVENSMLSTALNQSGVAVPNGGCSPLRKEGSFWRSPRGARRKRHEIDASGIPAGRLRMGGLIPRWCWKMFPHSQSPWAQVSSLSQIIRLQLETNLGLLAVPSSLAFAMR